MNTDPIYEADGKISVRKAVPFGLQHVLAMFVANIAPILIVTGVVKIPASEAGAIVQAAMIIAGIGSLLQMYPVFRLGSGLPVIMGISFTFVSVFCVIGLKYGYGPDTGGKIFLHGGLLGKVSDFRRLEAIGSYDFPARYFFQAQKRFHQCAFSCAVFTDDSEVVPFIDGEIQVGKNRFSVIRYGKMAACKQTHQLSASLRTFTLWFMRSI